MLFSFGVVLFLLIFVLPLAVIHRLRDRRFGGGGDDDQVQAQILRLAHRSRSRHDLNTAIREDSSHFAGADCFVYVFSNSGAARREISRWKHQLGAEGGGFSHDVILPDFLLRKKRQELTLKCMKLREIAGALGCEIRGNENLEISGVAGMEQAGPGELTFLANPKYAHKVKNTRAGAILVSQPLSDLAITSVLSTNPYLDFARTLAMFYQPPFPEPGISDLAFVHESAQVGENASIGPFAFVGKDVRLGRNAVLHPHVVIYQGAEIGDDFYAHSHASVREFCRIGNRVVLQNGVVVGGDGYGFAKRADGSHQKIVQSGATVIEDDVEIQSLTSVDRATIGETRVKRGAKIDSLVQIGHACVVGEDNIICAQTGLAGSSVLERNVLLAGQVGVSGHLTIHDNAIVYAQSGVGGDVAAGSIISGSPAFDAKDWLRAITAFPKLPEMLRAMRQLEKRVAELELAAQREPSA